MLRKPFRRAFKTTRKSSLSRPSQRGVYDRRLSLEPLEDRRLLAVSLTWPGAGNALSLTEDTSGATPAIVISEPTASGNLLKIDLGAGNVFGSSSTASATGLTYQNAGSPTTSQYATIDISTANAISVLQATLPGDDLTLGPVYDSNAGINGITASAGTIEVAGIDTIQANGNVNLAASGNLTVDAGATLTTGTGTISLAADVNADGTGNATGVGTLAIDAGALVTSTNATPSAITLRGAKVNIDTSSDPAVVGGLGQPNILSTTPTATLTSLDNPDALAFDFSGNLYVAEYANSSDSFVSEFAAGSNMPTALFTGLDNPDALAFDSSGNLFVANFGLLSVAERGTTVSEFGPGSTSLAETLTGLYEPDALKFDSSGNLFVANYGNGTVSEFAPGSTTPTATLTGLDNPAALAMDTSGNLYVANEGNNTVSELRRGASRPQRPSPGWIIPPLWRLIPAATSSWPTRSTRATTTTR